ncbi:MAG: hypothetical protein QOE06_932 [Thermoleophilaceae bacterium]|nr:hypothetical protein [Thermoleophilaceae bacterium]
MRLSALIHKARTKRILWTGNALRNYAREAPSPQLTADIFRGEWASMLPPPFEAVTRGSSELFDDDRVAWLIEQMGGVEGMRVLELGPLECGHTYMLQRAGAREIVAVEAHQRAYLRCLVVKELFALDRARLLHGDFVDYLKETDDTFDLCVASGVLYHMANPVELLGLIAKVAPKAFIWTHYHDPAGARHSGRFRRRATGARQASDDGFEHVLHGRKYGYSLFSAGFCGGSVRATNWLSRQDLMGALRHHGFGRIQVAFEQVDHPNGPALALLAERG